MQNQQNQRKLRYRRRFGVRRLLPARLFGRALLILVLPMVLSQLVIAHIFYDRHWSSVSRNMANSVVGDVVWLYQTYHDARQNKQTSSVALAQTAQLAAQLNASVILEDKKAIKQGAGKRLYPAFYKGLDERIADPVALEENKEEGLVYVRIATQDGMIVIGVSRKSLSSPTTTVFIIWMIGSSVLFTMIATVFLRNQIRPIVQLARVAEKLGLGQDVGNFKPRGASEVRRAGRAFLVMAERIRRHLQNRTEMLAGISHDLRTPLTRMKLELELATMDAVTRGALAADIDEMGKMIDGYLDFARGDTGEIMESININLLLTDIASDYKRSRRRVDYARAGETVNLMIRPQAIRRALMNIIDNALRYGNGVATVVLEQSATFVRIKVTDSGPGIPEAEQENVFKPFTRLEPSRNSQTGGVGLGLSIARAIAQSHGGDVTLENRCDEHGKIIGLEATFRLPRAVQTKQ